jgi:hypothetical protein
MGKSTPQIKPYGAFFLTALRLVAADGNVNQGLVKQGWCW